MGYLGKGIALASTVFSAFESFVVNANYKDCGIRQFLLGSIHALQEVKEKLKVTNHQYNHQQNVKARGLPWQDLKKLSSYASRRQKNLRIRARI